MGYNFFLWDNNFMSHFSGQFEGASTFLTPKLSLRGQKSLGPLKMSLEMAHKVIVPQKKIMSRSFLNSETLIVIMISFKLVRIFPIYNFNCILSFQFCYFQSLLTSPLPPSHLKYHMGGEIPSSMYYRKTNFKKSR